MAQKTCEGSLHPRPEGRGIRDPPRSRCNKYNEAIHAYNKAIEFEPLHSAAWNQRGNVLVEQAHALIRENVGRIWSNTSDTILQLNYYYSEALKSYDMAIDINPRYGMFWWNKGDVLRLLGRTNEANAAFTRARELGYTSPSSACNL